MPKIIELVERLLAHRPSRTKLRTLLKAHGLSWKKCRKVLRKADPEKRRAFIEQFQPIFEQVCENKTILIGTPEQVAEGVQFYRDLLGVEHLTIFPHLLGDSYAKANEQMTRFQEEVVPLLS